LTLLDQALHQIAPFSVIHELEAAETGVEIVEPCMLD
jgi:hypothetical protein